MDLLLSWQANTNEQQPTTHLKPCISANPTNTIEKVEVCIVFLLFYEKLCDLRGMILPRRLQTFCPRAKQGNTKHVEGRTS